MATADGNSNSYSREEVSALKGLFSLYDTDDSGYISVKEVDALLQKIGRSGDDAAKILEGAEKVAQEGRITFEDFLGVLEKGNADVPGEGPDPKVLEFLRILEEYRVKCEDEGNYLEAGRANAQVETLRRQEEKRQQKAIRARQINERTEVQIAHNMQYTDFNAAWDKYMEEYDSMAQMYIQQMTERHAVNLLEFQRGLQKEMTQKPPKWSRELLEWRRRQHILARQKNYAEAQKIKKIADGLEDKERGSMNTSHAAVFARKEASFRQQQQAELQALLKRIDARRKEHIKQRNLDCKRLLQRNRNVQAVLESKQAVESVKLFADIKKDLQHSLALSTTRAKASVGGQ
ncbi:hypothetical protein TrCOL_g2121 [Triparma columacea]|uniref:EF-hand domain-containing protein n=1 Tax=Triparma columacea TaxID=722753 RepID=A0A9W7G8U6_9STRA|nr:hypothetical protein TrCOL_g2121 [Triparma columacea]